VDSPQKLAFVVQSNRLQGLMWQALLKSQKLAVIVEPSSGDLADCIRQIAVAGLTLPDVIVLDTEAAELNPYEFCRWCRDAFPQMQIFLTRCRQLPVSDTERRWAKQQGATDFLGGFDRDTLMTRATGNVKFILNSLDYPFLNEKALLTVLLNIRRQLSTTSAVQETATRPADRPGRKVEGQLTGLPLSKTAKVAPMADTPSAPAPLNDVDWVSSGLRALDSTLASAVDQAPHTTPPPAIKVSSMPKPAVEKIVDGTAVRRYRGIVY
jgi:CheY-like chemotaxis protein